VECIETRQPCQRDAHPGKPQRSYLTTTELSLLDVEAVQTRLEVQVGLYKKLGSQKALASLEKGGGLA